MAACEHSGPKALPSAGGAGFSLIEVTLSIGIVAFAFVAVFGLIPVGLNTFRQAMDLTQATRIGQREVANYQEKDFDLVITKPGASQAYDGTPSNETWRATPDGSLLWYDDGGGYLSISDSEDKARAVYCANIRVMPATPLPLEGGGTLADNPNIATVTVQVAFNPSQQDLAFFPGSPSDQRSPMRNLWNGAFAKEPDKTGVVPIFTYTARVARN